jgi:uncharacterized protein YbaP (TraB family)
MKHTLVFLAFLAGTLSANAQILWKVSGNGLQKPSYILGTHHVASKDICDNIAGFNDAYAGVEQVYGEVDTEIMNNPATQFQMMPQMTMPKGQTLSSLYTEEQVKKIDEYVTSLLGVGIKAFDKLKPAVVSSSIQAIIAMKMYPGFDATKGIDSQMQSMAKKDNKATQGLETMDFQIDILYNAPLQEQAEDLLEMVEHGKETEEMIIELTNRYLKQDLAGLWELMLEDSEPEELEKLVYSRNRNWTAQMKDIMPQNPTMFVVGAGHLPGEQGLIKLLEQEGYKLEPVW